MTSFQGYAQRSSVSENTIKVEDPSKKILAEAQNTLQKWKARSSHEQASREQYISALRDNFNKEQAVRDSNRRLEKEFAQGWIDARAKNWEIKIANAEGEAKNAQPPMLQQLAELAPTLAKAYQGIDDKRRADGRELGMMLAEEHGITMQDLWAYDKIKGQMANDDTALNAYQKELRDRGVGEDVVTQIGRLSGYQRLGIAEADLVRGAQNYAGWIGEQLPREVDLPGGMGKASLATAMETKNLKLQAMVQRQLRKEYNAKYKKYNEKLRLKILTPKMNLVDGRMKSSTVEGLKKQLEEENQQKIDNDFGTSIEVDGVEGYFGFTKRHAGLDNEFITHANNLAHNAHVRRLEAGKGNLGFMQELFNYEYIPRGEKKKVKWGERNWRKVDELKAAWHKGEMEKMNRREEKDQLEKSKNKARAQEVEEFITKNYEKLTPDHYEQMYRLTLKDKSLNQVRLIIDKRRKLASSEVNNTFHIPKLNKLYNHNMLTRAAVLDARLTPEKTGIWLKKADEQDKTKPSEETDKLFEQTAGRAIEGILDRYGTETKKVPSSALVKVDMQNALRNYYKAAMIDTDNPSKARDLALGQLNTDLQGDKYKIVERRSVNGKIIQDPHFGNFQLKATRTEYPMTELREKVRNNPNIWQEEVIVAPEQTLQTAYNISAGINKGFPAAYSHFVNSVVGRNPDGTTKITEAEVFRHQLQLLVGEKKAKELIPDELFDLTRQAEELIMPEFRKLLGLGPQGIAVATHYSKQTQANNYKPKEDNKNYTEYKSGSIYRKPENLSENAKVFLEKHDIQAKPKPKSWRDIKKGGPGDFSWGGYEDQKPKSWKDIKKGGPGDFSWGGYEDQKRKKEVTE